MASIDEFFDNQVEKDLEVINSEFPKQQLVNSRNILIKLNFLRNYALPISEILEIPNEENNYFEIYNKTKLVFDVLIYTRSIEELYYSMYGKIKAPETFSFRESMDFVINENKKCRPLDIAKREELKKFKKDPILELKFATKKDEPIYFITDKANSAVRGYTTEFFKL